MAKLDPRIEVIREKYGLDASDFWELPQKKGTWVAKHSALEVAAAKAGIRFDMPQILEANGAEGVAAVCVRGEMGDRFIWSIGEASPKNCRNAYPWAMAEKRAIDRVILKLIGIHGLVYSEEEADFERPAPSNLKRDLEDSVALETAASKTGAKWSTPVEKQREIWTALRDELDACPAVDDLATLWKSKAFQDEFKKLQPGWQDLLTERKEELKAGLAKPVTGRVAPNFDQMETAR